MEAEKPLAQGIIFDIDGTLLDSVDFHAAAWQRAMERFGKQIAWSAIRAQIGKGADQLMPIFLSKAEIATFGHELERLRGRIFKEKYLHHVRPFSGVRELFLRLRAEGCKLALASSAKEDELHEYQAIAQIEGLIESGASSEDVERSKPHPDIFETALKTLGADTCRKDVLVIGDSPWDAEGARKAGLKAIGVLCGGFSAETLQSARCSLIYHGPADLLVRCNLLASTSND